MGESERRGGRGCLDYFTSAIISEGQGKLRAIAGGGTLDSDKLSLSTLLTPLTKHQFVRNETLHGLPTIKNKTPRCGCRYLFINAYLCKCVYYLVLPFEETQLSHH